MRDISPSFIISLLQVTAVLNGKRAMASSGGYHL